MTAPREEVPLGRFNYELCAQLHNQIFLIAWKGSGRSPDFPFSTWWEHYQPSAELASRYHPWLVKFLQRVYYHPEAPEFLYYLRGLNRAQTLIHDDFNERFDGRDCYVLLHPATGWKMGDEYGIIFDQITCKAVFAEDLDSTHPICNYGWGFQPLEDIYSAYLQMISENKMEICRAPDGQWPRELLNRPAPPIGPWRYHPYTAADVHKAAHAFQRLLHEITIRLPPCHSSPVASSPLPWADPSVRLDARILPNSFAGAFCAATATTTSTHPLTFRYIAPGIRLPTESKFQAQPFRDVEYKDPHHRALPHERPIRPTLLFLAESVNGWARRSDGTRMGDDLLAEKDPADENFDLYQCFVDGVGPCRDVSVHKVLENWAERVRGGEWGVDGDGVVGGDWEVSGGGYGRWVGEVLGVVGWVVEL
ncbi:hypothetical protein BO78DRAFT_372107, partial [Aspergillus sclerotiicarbonarius CBS 121057]